MSEGGTSSAAGVLAAPNRQAVLIRSSVEPGRGSGNAASMQEMCGRCVGDADWPRAASWELSHPLLQITHQSDAAHELRRALADGSLSYS